VEFNRCLTRKGKPVERQGRKTSGLTGMAKAVLHDSGAAAGAMVPRCRDLAFFYPEIQVNFRFNALAAVSIFATLTMATGAAHAAPHEHLQEVDRMLAKGREHVKQEFVIEFKDGVSQAEKDAILRNMGGRRSGVLMARRNARGNVSEMNLVRGTRDMRSMMTALNVDDRVAYAEPNWVYHPQAVPSDPYVKQNMTWNMYGPSTSPSAPYGTGALGAWNANHTCGNTPVYVGVVDEGILISHPDLKANIWTNPYDRANGADDDGNGYVDDVNGYNFFDNNNNVNGSATEQHGTHVAGIIGAQGNNAAGIAGMCWNIKIIPAKFMDAKGGTLANAIRAIDYLTNLKLKKNLRIVAINNSWGGPGQSLALQQAIERANDADILFVAAAGNGDANGIGVNNDVTPTYPANYKTANVISVASIDQNGMLSKFSNYGATSVHLAAPGGNILSTIPTASGAGYGYMSGTSMAAPHVTAAIALYAATHPLAKAPEIKAAILNGVRKTGTVSGTTITGGILDVSKF